MQIILDIVIMIIILGVLISLHEAGHLGMAKLFKVYCFEYSIGFGPKLLKVRRKGGETYFALRGFPLGGYVSMYGEPGVIPQGFEEPDASRSLESINKWKKAGIMIAGVVVNEILGIFLLFASAFWCPQYFYGIGIGFAGQSSSGEETTLISAYSPAAYEDGGIAYQAIDGVKESAYEVKDYYLYLGTTSYPSLNSNSMYGSIVDSDVTVYDINGVALTSTYVAVYAPSTLISNHSLMNDLYLYPASSVVPSSVDQAYSKALITHFPDVPSASNDNKDLSLKVADHIDGSYSFSLDLTLFPNPETYSSETDTFFDHRISASVSVTLKDQKWSSIGLDVAVISERYKPATAWNYFSQLVPTCHSAIFQGLASIFTSGINNLSGIVGMTAAIGTYSAMGGVGRILMYAGLISINLAIFNLLPFPGLDGWQLLVTFIEGVSRKKVPNKVKAIVSYIGLGLLFVLAIAITVKDIVGLF